MIQIKQKNLVDDKLIETLSVYQYLVEQVKPYYDGLSLEDLQILDDKIND